MGSSICDREVNSTICGGKVIAIKTDGRFWYHKGVFINIPKNFVTCKCEVCGNEYASDLMIIAMEKVLEEEYNKKEWSGWNLINHRQLIEESKWRYKEKQL